jgi:hypothetical protein
MHSFEPQDSRDYRSVATRDMLEISLFLTAVQRSSGILKYYYLQISYCIRY